MFKPTKTLSLSLSLLLVCQQLTFALEAVQEQQPMPLSVAAMAKLEKFNNKTKSSWNIRMNAQKGTPRALVSGTGMNVGKTQGAALSFLKSNSDFLGVDRAQLKLKVQRKSAIGNHFYFDQYYKDLKVENAYVKVNADNNGRLINYQSTFVNALELDIKPVLNAASAQSIAAADVAGTAKSAELVIYSAAEGAQADLAWKVNVQQGEVGKWDYFINATDGKILNKVSKIMYGAATFNAKLNPVYPGFGGLDDTMLPISGMNVQYFGSPTVLVTDAAGMVTLPNARRGRVYSTFSGPFFSVSDQRNPYGFYVESGQQPLIEAAQQPLIEAGQQPLNNEDENLPMVWESKASGSAVNPSSIQIFKPAPTTVCEDATQSPLIATPIFTSFAVGAMVLFSGEIEAGKKVFLGVSEASKTLAKYIGNITTFNGPLIPFLSNNQVLNFGVLPSGKPGSYNVATVKWLCLPPTIPESYTTRTTHSMPQLSTPSANAFYNLNAARNFFQTLNVGNYINLSGHLPVIINAFGSDYASGAAGMLNAFYDVDQKIIMYGQGEKMSGQTTYKNFALESTIVRHEYVHAVIDNIWPIMYFDEGAAIAEAASDYFALSSLKDAGGTPYTSEIGTFVALSTATGEGATRNLNGDAKFDPLTWVANGINGQHKNSLVLSQALWEIRTNATSKNYADAIVWNALMFFPDSLLEFRDAVIAAAKALGHNEAISIIETAFDKHQINYDHVITPNGDIYEPNNSPDSAANIDIASISKKELKATLAPISDTDYFSVALPAGAFEATVTMQQANTTSPVTYYPLSMILLDANLKTVVDIVRPAMVTGQMDQTTKDKTLTLKYNAPGRLDGNTGRYILGVFKPIDAAYPRGPVINSTGAYTLNFKFTKGSNVGDVTTVIPDFGDGTSINFSVPYNTYGNITPATNIPADLADWQPNAVEAFHSVRILDNNLAPLPDNYLTVTAAPRYDVPSKTLQGTVAFANGFSALGYNTVYLQVFGKLRVNAAYDPATNPQYNPDYGIVSLGISNPIRNQVSSGRDVYIESPIFNPDKGGSVKIEVNVKQDGKVKVQVFTLDGLLVKDLFDGDLQAILPEYITWDGKNANGNTVASGLYLLRINGGGINKQLKKIVVVK